MGKKTSPSEDRWFGVQDAKKRKQIQDRLAQRARRQRLAHSKSSPQSSSTESECDASHSYAVYSHLPNTGPFVPYVSDLPRLSPISVDHALLSTSNMTVYSALFNNGIILGIACGSSSVACSKPPLSHVPESLHPTKLQLEQVHFDWIDRFPMRDFRDRMIEFSDLLNVEAFLLELFTRETFIFAPGGASWDPVAWQPTDGFRTRWSYLFADDATA